jgi:hypothetical protein
LRTCQKLLTVHSKLAHIPHSSQLLRVSNLQAQSNIPIAILVVLLKHVRHPLQAYTRLDEQVETQRIASVAVVCAVEQCDELLGEAVSEGDEGFVEFRKGDAARVVLVEAVEEVAPGGEETP